MPSKSEQQHRMMQAIAADPKFASKVGVSQKVGREFVLADRLIGKYQPKKKG